ncbi:MAG TPA: hypothetical protein VH331_17645 [Allosphingosinicella sp.]|jgi:hypothetical protein|nr:hypothetical protein [Allosphingosinicella sp.]
MVDPSQDPAAAEHSVKRREALARIGRFSAYTAPLVLGMLTATKAVAQTTGTPPPPAPPPPPPPDGCCWVEALLASGQKVGEALEGAPLLMMELDGSGIYEGAVERTRPSVQPCLFFQTRSGIGLTLSESTPIPVHRDGAVDYLVARDVLTGDVLPVQDADGFRWESLDVIEERGTLPVSLLSAGNGVYAAGDEAGRLIFTHNFLKV